MKNLYLLLLFAIPLFITAQNRNIKITRSNQDFVKANIEVDQSSNIRADQFFQIHGSDFGFTDATEMNSILQENESTQFKHYKFKQYYKGLEIYGTFYNLHEKEGKLLNGNGTIIPEQNLAIDPSISKEIAVKIAEEELSKITNTYELLNNKLVIINDHYPQFDGNYILAYVMEFHSNSGIEDSRKMIIDANSGKVINHFSTQKNCFKDKGIAKTLFHGSREINTEKEGQNYLTKDLSRGGGIFATNKGGKLYADSDNLWEAGTNDYNNGVHDLFWSLEKTYDFYKSKFNRNGADNAGLPIRAFLLDTENYVNAFWSPTLYTLNFGIGDHNNYKPLTSIDVVGHEFTHGVTQFTSGLEYLYEAGALNEAFSDIMGKAIENEFDRDSFNWYVGGRFAKTKDLAFRNMQDPIPYNCPQFYKGKKWVTNTGDNGGVHTNSGVLNYWYYLLCTGLKDTNELNVIYDVKRMGFDTATKLAYTLLNNYLGITTTYYDTREASLLLASNWWGACSPEYMNIVEAWKAVGVGAGNLDNDLQLISTKPVLQACKDGYYSVETRINNQACAKEIPAGTEINMFYKLDTFPIVKEIITLAKSISGGSHLDYVFKAIPRIVKAGQSRLTVWMEAGIDSDTSNNRFVILLNRLGNSTDNDFRLNNFNIIGAPCPNATNEYLATLVSTYNGCSIIPVGSDFELQFVFKDSSSIYKFKSLTSVYPQAQMTIPNIRIPRSFLGLKKVALNLVWVKDTVLANNKINTQIVMINKRSLNEVETFSDNKYDSTKIQVSSDSFNITSILPNSSFTSTSLVTTGGKILNPNGSLIPRPQQDLAAMYQSNPKFTSKIYICADVANITQPKIEFDLAQKKGQFKYDSVNIPNPSATRIIYFDALNTNLGVNYYSVADDNWDVQHIAEDIPAGTSFIEITNLCLKGGIDPLTGFLNTDGDFVIIDNVVITGLSSVRDEQREVLYIQPNPSQGLFQIFSKDESLKEMSIYSAIGELFLKKHFQNSDRNYSLEINKKGTYFLHYLTENGKAGVKKLIVF